MLFGPPSDANGDAPVASFPNPEVANAEVDDSWALVVSDVLEVWSDVASIVPAVEALCY